MIIQVIRPSCYEYRSPSCCYRPMLELTSNGALFLIHVYRDLTMRLWVVSIVPTWCEATTCRMIVE